MPGCAMYKMPRQRTQCQDNMESKATTTKIPLELCNQSERSPSWISLHKNEVFH